jgi:endonuclease-3
VPADLDALVKLPGIGRKTANVVLGNAFGIPGIVVDTHVGRVSARLGLTSEKDAEKIERDLMALIPKERWIIFSHQLIQHGRRICIARKPKCSICPLRPQCIYGMDESAPKA